MVNEEKLLANAVIVTGAPRSGTTLLGDILGQHAALAYANEPRLVWRWGNDGKSDLLRAGDARPEVRRYIRRTFAARVGAAGRQRFLDKTPSNSLRIEFVDAVFPDSKIVHIMRNGRDSVLGIRSFWEGYSTGLQTVDLGKRLREVRLRQVPYYAREVIRRVGHGIPGVRPNVWGPRLPGIDGLLQDLTLLEVCCMQWRMCVEAACQAGRRLGPSRYLECRLEDLSHDLISRVLEFCELEDDPQLRSYFDGIFDGTLSSARRAKASAEDLETIDRWIEPTLAWLGYE